MYDVMRTETFNSVKQWMTDITEVCIATAKIIIHSLYSLENGYSEFVLIHIRKMYNNNTCYIDRYTIMEHIYTLYTCV